jgi:hypothetical protein
LEKELSFRLLDYKYYYISNKLIMTTEEKRIKILEHLGWTELKRGEFCLRGTTPNGEKRVIPPNYFKSLDSMRKLELTMWNEEELVEEYQEKIEYLYLRAVGYQGCSYWWMCNASTRAEAYGLVMGLWE